MAMHMLHPGDEVWFFDGSADHPWPPARATVLEVVEMRRNQPRLLRLAVDGVEVEGAIAHCNDPRTYPRHWRTIWAQDR